MGNSPPQGFRSRQASAFAKASVDKLAGQVGVRRRRGGRKMVNYPLNLRPAKNRDAPPSKNRLNRNLDFHGWQANAVKTILK
jgi:hypothetical protein